MLTRFAARTGRCLVPGIAAVFLLAACGGDGDGTTIGSAAPSVTGPSVTTPTSAAPTGADTTTTPGTGPSATASATSEGSAPATDRCHTGEFTAAFGPEDAGAGNRNASVVLTNKGGRTCTVFGYGGLQPLDAAGKPITTLTLTRVNPKPTLLRVAPGGKAYKGIHWTVIASTGQKCVDPASAQVTPPDETDHITLKWPFGTVCGMIDGRPYTTTAP